MNGMAGVTVPYKQKVRGSSPRPPTTFSITYRDELLVCPSKTHPKHQTIRTVFASALSSSLRFLSCSNRVQVLQQRPSDRRVYMLLGTQATTPAIREWLISLLEL